jgi:hypothetical protein
LLTRPALKIQNEAVSRLNFGTSLQDGAGPQSYQAVAFAESPAVRDIAAAQTKRRLGKRDVKSVDREEAVERQREKSKKAGAPQNGNLVARIITNGANDADSEEETEKKPDEPRNHARL